MSDATFTIRTPDAEGNTLEAGPFTADELNRAASTLKGKTPLKPDPDFDAAGEKAHRAAAGELRAFLERIERVREEKAELASDEKEIFAEAKGRGYSTKAMRVILKERASDPDKLAEEAAILELYRDTLAME